MLWTRHIRLFFRTFKKKSDLSFVLVLAASLCLAAFTGLPNTRKHELKNTLTHDLTYIKPLTSLAGFNLKFGRKDKDASVYSLGLIIHL